MRKEIQSFLRSSGLVEKLLTSFFNVKFFVKVVIPILRHEEDLF